MTKILAALGVESEEHALQAIERFNLFLSATRAESGTDSFDGVVASLKDGKALASVVAELTGKSGPEAIGALHALKAQAESAAEARAKLEQIEAANAAAEAARVRAEALASVDAAVTAGKLPPASKDKAVALLDKHGPEVLAAYLDALPVVVSATVPQPAPVAGSESATPSDEEIAKVAASLGITVEKAKENWARYGAKEHS